MSGEAGNQQDRAALDRLIRGFQISRMIRLVADLTLADRITAEETSPMADLAAECKVNATPLLRILRALASFGIFRVTAAPRSDLPYRPVFRGGNSQHNAQSVASRSTGRRVYAEKSARTFALLDGRASQSRSLNARSQLEPGVVNTVNTPV